MTQNEEFIYFFAGRCKALKIYVNDFNDNDIATNLAYLCKDEYSDLTYVELITPQSVQLKNDCYSINSELSAAADWKYIPRFVRTRCYMEPEMLDVFAEQLGEIQVVTHKHCINSESWPVFFENSINRLL
ncbi:hypothetical protein LPJ73_004723, partial [Coemansia sp. RSA 2703]